MGAACLKLTNLPSSLHATLNLYVLESELGKIDSVGSTNLVKETLCQLQHVEKLEIGHWMMEVLSSCEEEEDKICGLSDSVIHRILSFWPSTENTHYNKSWHHHWISVPILNFVPNEKFCIDSEDMPFMYLDPRLALWIRFAVKRGVKELILDNDCYFVVEIYKLYPLPQFLFNNSSLVKMKLCACLFNPRGKVNWKSLGSLCLNYCKFDVQVIGNVIDGSPLLECLELNCCGFEGELVIASRHLKTFGVKELDCKRDLIEICCPNLENLDILGIFSTLSRSFFGHVLMIYCLKM